MATLRSFYHHKDIGTRYFRSPIVAGVMGACCLIAIPELQQPGMRIFSDPTCSKRDRTAQGLSVFLSQFAGDELALRQLDGAPHDRSRPICIPAHEQRFFLGSWPASFILLLARFRWRASRAQARWYGS